MNATFSVHFSHFSLSSLLGFKQFKNAIIKPVESGPIYLSEFIFYDFSNVYKEENGLGRLMNLKEIEQKLRFKGDLGADPGIFVRGGGGIQTLLVMLKLFYR